MRSVIVPTAQVVSATPQDTMLKSVAEALSKKYHKPADSYIVTLSTKSGNYAKGSVTVMGEQGGGLWFAANVYGVWQLVYDGNGIVTCSNLTAYPDFPSTLIPQCFDEGSNTLKKR